MTTDNLPQVQNQSSAIGMPSAQEFQMLQVIAKNAQDSGLYAGVGQQAKIFMVLLAARELGISPMLALNGGIWNIQGKIEISARLMNGLIRRAGHSLKIIRSDDECCTLKGTRTDGDSFEVSFTKEDATKAGLWGNNTWKKYPADMLYNRCMSRLARRLFSDVIGTAYVEGEIREAKEVEKWEKAEYEEVKPNILSLKEDNKQSKAPIEPCLEQEEKITPQQLAEMLQLYEKTDAKFRENYEKYTQTEWKLTSPDNLTLSQYTQSMKWITMNIKAQTQGVINKVEENPENEKVALSA